MSFRSKSLRGAFSIIVAAGLVILFAGPTTQAQAPVLWVKVFDTTTSSGAQNTAIPIYMNNYQDTVAGFNLWIQLDRDDIMEFQTDSGIFIDTTWWECLEWVGPDCVDSHMVPEIDTMGDTLWDWYQVDTFDIVIGNFDTTGCLTSGWQYMQARSISGYGIDLNIAGIANTADTPFVAGIAPQMGGTLVKILADVFTIPDSIEDRTSQMMIVYNFLDHYNFSRPDGSSIGLKTDTVPDTNCWICTAWAGDVCLNWIRVSLPPPGGCDSTEEVMEEVVYVDTNVVTLENGSLTVQESYLCGDVDGTWSVDVGDLTFLVAYLFQGGAAPVPVAAADMDCDVDPMPNVGDLTYLVAFLFQGGSAPCGC
ncbi:MAG: hypothetical protein ABII79_02715 [bacterium]